MVIYRPTQQKIEYHGQIQAVLLRSRAFIPVFFNKQIQKGTFEYTLHYLVDNELGLSMFDARFNNDKTGAPAYDPRILIKIIPFAYSRGITSSRRIARCCEENVVFMALSANSRPHFTTITDFISSIALFHQGIARPMAWWNDLMVALLMCQRPLVLIHLRIWRQKKPEVFKKTA